MRVTYIGHATLLIEIGTQRLLTDPNFDDTLGRFLPGSAAGIALADLPRARRHPADARARRSPFLPTLNQASARHPTLCTASSRHLAHPARILARPTFTSRQPSHCW